MEPSKKEIKSWLKKKNRTYAWLAKKCKRTEGTIKNWFGQKPIPGAQLRFITSLMEMEEQTPSSKNDYETVVCLFTPEEYNLLKDAASRQGKTIREWGEQILLEDARRRFSEKSAKTDKTPPVTPYAITRQSTTKKVAESPEEYRVEE